MFTVFFSQKKHIWALKILFMNFSLFSKIQIIDVNLVSYYTYCVHILIHNITVKTVSLVYDKSYVFEMWVVIYAE